MLRARQQRKLSITPVDHEAQNSTTFGAPVTTTKQVNVLHYVLVYTRLQLLSRFMFTVDSSVEFSECHLEKQKYYLRTQSLRFTKNSVTHFQQSYS